MHIETAFHESYERHQPALTRYLQGMTHDPAAAEDVCQEAFVRLYDAMRAGRCPDDALAWLRRVGRNLVISRARRAQVAHRHAPRLCETVSHDPTSSLALEHERIGDLRVALARIPDEQRHLLLLAASGFTRAQIGAELGANAGAVRTRLHRARRLLLGELAAADAATAASASQG